MAKNSIRLDVKSMRKRLAECEKDIREINKSIRRQFAGAIREITYGYVGRNGTPRTVKRQIMVYNPGRNPTPEERRKLYDLKIMASIMCSLLAANRGRVHYHRTPAYAMRPSYTHAYAILHSSFMEAKPKKERPAQADADAVTANITYSVKL